MIKIGNLQINKLYLGSYEIVAAYLGNTQVYGGTGPGPEPGEWILDENSYIVGADGQYYERWVQGTFTVPTTDLNDDDWKVDTVGTEYDTDPDFNYFMSDKNWHVANSFAQCKVSWIGPTNFNLKYRSNAESVYDYIVIGGLDGDKFETQPNWNTEGILAHTRGQQGGDYKDLYIDCDEGEHHVWCAYIKDGSADSGDDRAYIGVPKQIGTITAERAGDLLPSTYVATLEYVKVDDDHIALKNIRRYTLPNGTTIDNQDDYTYTEQILCDYLTYTLCDDVDDTIITLEDGTDSVNIEYETNGSGVWNTWDLQPLTLTRDSDGDGYIKLRGVNQSRIGTLKSSNRVNVSGNAISLFGGEKTSTDLNVVLYKLFSGSNIVDASGLKLYPIEFQFYDNLGVYDSMFKGCTSLVTAPELPATKLSVNCYREMFYGCTSLVTAPELPATLIAEDCYVSMFSGCTSLVNAPSELSHTDKYMFKDCTSLVTAPSFSNGEESLFEGCTSLVNVQSVIDKGYKRMFCGCTSLVTAPEFSDTSSTVYCESMFSGCTSLVTAPALPSTRLSSNCYNSMFSGCTSLVNAPALPATTLSPYCYNSMFSGCTSLVNAPALPATETTQFTYASMFSGCTSLVNAPVISATSAAFHAFDSMFKGCTSLVTAPELPATQIYNYAYSNMFEGCTALVNAPELPTTNFIPLPELGKSKECYKMMFKDCTSLINAPALPATTLGQGVYYAMFFGCTSLVNAPALPATILEQDCYTQMFYDCQSLQTAPVLPAATLTGSCYSYMFANCSNLNNVTCLATDMSAYDCTGYWLLKCAREGTFTKAVGADWSSLEEPSGIPPGWTVIEQ